VRLNFSFGVDTGDSLTVVADYFGELCFDSAGE
jgi:hypothetical protein